MDMLSNLAHEIIENTLTWEMLVVLAPMAVALLPLLMPWGRWFVGCIILLPFVFFLFIMNMMLEDIDGPDGFAVAFYMGGWFVLFVSAVAFRLLLAALIFGIKKWLSHKKAAIAA